MSSIFKSHAQNWNDHLQVCGAYTYPLRQYPYLRTFFRSAQRGGTIRLTSSASFGSTLTRALARINGLIASKLDDFFGLSEYDWTPSTNEDSPSLYLYELGNWLTTVLDSLVIKEVYKDEVYGGAVAYIAECLMVGSHIHFISQRLKRRHRTF
jgi:hypothetical protein